MSHLGEIRYNNKGTKMEIVVYKKSDDIDVKFLDGNGYIKEHTTYVNFKRGQVKNPYDITVCNKGFIGDGEYMAKINRKPTLQYQTWQAMLRRCYDPKFVDLQPAYYGISEVCDEWLNYQTFAKWYDAHYYKVGTERMHVDKDILYKGNKIYCPEKCIIVPQRINMIFMGKLADNNLPLGVKKNGDRYEASYGGKSVGTFDSIEEAAIAHDMAKKQNIIEVANEYKSVIPIELYNALINWEPDYKEGFQWAA